MANAYAGLNPPENTDILWLDLNENPAYLKYYNASIPRWEKFVNSYSPDITIDSSITDISDAITNLNNHLTNLRGHFIFCTSATKPSTAQLGQHIFTTDTLLEYVNISLTSTPNWRLEGNNIVNSPPIITSFTNNINITEYGSTINSITFNWIIDKDIESQTLTDVTTLLSTDRTTTLSGLNLTSDKDYTLSVDDGTNTVTKTTSIKFLNKRYWGTSNSTTLNNSEILALGSSEFVSNDNKSTGKTFDCSGGKYIYVVIPKSLGELTFEYNGIIAPFIKTELLGFVNVSGGISDYYIYRSYNKLNSNSITIKIN